MLLSPLMKMTETAPVTGSRDDLQIDASRCLRMRHSESSCNLCVSICPHRALSLDRFLAVNPNHCKGCLLCTAVCPSGALEQNFDFSSCLAQLSRIPEPVFGCSRTKDHSNAFIACLGGLSSEHLLALCYNVKERLILNLSLCSDCPNSQMVSVLRQNLEALAEKGLLVGGCDIFIADSTADIHYRDESVDRRSFFKSFRNSLFRNAVAVLSPPREQSERRTPYAGKRLPTRRELLNRARNRISTEIETGIRKHFDTEISFSDSCTKCQGCVAICPTGALQTGNTDSSPEFVQLLCTGCGLCVEFCIDEGLSISSEGGKV